MIEPSPRASAIPEERIQKILTVTIAIGAILGIATHLILRYATGVSISAQQIPLWIVLVGGGVPLCYELLLRAFRREFGSDLLAGISIVTACLLGQTLAGSIIVLMLSGGQALEAFAVRRASSALRALASRMPAIAHRRVGDRVTDIATSDVGVDDTIMVFPHEVCPVDGVVIEGHGAMDEAFVTGEPFHLSKAPGTSVISGAVNGESALTIRATRLPADSRYAKILGVMRRAEDERPRMRRLGDQLGAYYTPLALLIALAAWAWSGQSIRFLSVLVVATPCPLLIAIPVSILGAISLCARRAIIVRDPAAMEQVSTCKTAIFDKTGTLTYGRPSLVEQVIAPGFDAGNVLALVASMERYSKHPLARAILGRATEMQIQPREATQIHEPPGQGLTGIVAGHRVEITSRRKIIQNLPEAAGLIPPAVGGLECFILIDGHYAAAYQFRDEPRADGAFFIEHLKPKHGFTRVMIVSGDREAEVRYLAHRMGISDVHAEQTPEQKVQLVNDETSRARTMYVGDGVNDAPALVASTVGIAIGNNSEATTEAADVVIMDSSLEKVDEFLHISRRMRRIALESALGGIALSLVGMIIASTGLLTPVAGAIAQELIDVLAVLNALRAAAMPANLSDFTSRTLQPRAVGSSLPSLAHPPAVAATPTS